MAEHKLVIITLSSKLSITISMKKITTLACVFFMLAPAACSDERTRQLNRVSKDVIEAARNSKQTAKDGIEKVRNMEMPGVPEVPSKEDLVEVSDAFVDKVSTATAEKVAERLKSDLDKKTKGIEESYSGAKRSVQQTKDSTRAKIRWIKRRTPRSEKEANQIVYHYGKDWGQQFQAWLDSIAKQGSFRVDKRRERLKGRQKK